MTANRAVKRAIDVILVVASAPITIPLSLAAAACVLLFDGRPVLYRQIRCGEGGRRFVLLKLRSMAAGDGASVTTAADPRVTRCGAVLRRLKLDESPQLWNVLRGEMSLVGPRPEVPRWVDRFPAEFRLAHSSPAGLTDFASIYFRDEADVIQRLTAVDPTRSVDDVYTQVILPIKLDLNRRYAERSGVLVDLAVIGVTVYVVMFRRLPTRFMTRLSGTSPPLCIANGDAR